MKSKLYCILLISLLFLAFACNKNKSATNQSDGLVQAELENQNSESTVKVDVGQTASSEQEIEPIDEDFYPAEDDPDLTRDYAIESLIARSKKPNKSVKDVESNDDDGKTIIPDEEINKKIIAFINDYRCAYSKLQTQTLSPANPHNAAMDGYYYEGVCDGPPHQGTYAIFIVKDDVRYEKTILYREKSSKIKGDDSFSEYFVDSIETIIGYIKDDEVVYLENEVYDEDRYWIVSNGNKSYIYADWRIVNLYIRESDVPLILETLKTSEMTDRGQFFNFNDNKVSLSTYEKKRAEFSLNHFTLKKEKGLKHGVSARYSFVEDPDAIGVPKYRKYEGELYLFSGDREIKPVLNIVHELEESYGAKIKLLNCRSDADTIKVEYEVQLYDQKAAGFGTVEITYEIGGNPYKGYVYNVKDYKSDITGRFKHTDEDDPEMTVPSMDGDVTVNVDFPLEKFIKIADQVLSFAAD